MDAVTAAATLVAGSNFPGVGGAGDVAVSALTDAANMGHVLQVTNIAPQATRDQMQALFSFIGKIDDLRLYPTVRDASVTLDARCCFVKFGDLASVHVAQHLNNTVFIDRAIIIQPVAGTELPDETLGLQMAATASAFPSTAGNGPAAGVMGLLTAAAAGRAGGAGALEPKLPPNVVNRLEGVAPHAVIMTHDPRLEEAGLPAYPGLPASTSNDRVEEIRRTISVFNLDSTVSAQQCMEYFAEAGEVKYFRYCTKERDPVKYALIEFTEQPSVVAALKMNDRQLGMSLIKVTHSVQAISKPRTKTNEAAQREIEEAMSKVKEAQSLVSAAVDPLMGMLGGAVSARASASRTTRSRSGSRSKRRSRSRGRSSYNSRRSRSRDRDRRRRSRTRSRDRRRSKSRDRRRRSRSRDRKRRHSRSRSRDRDRDRRRRSRSRERDRDRGSRRDREKEKDREREREREREKEKDRSSKAEENGDKEKKKYKEDSANNADSAAENGETPAAEGKDAKKESSPAAEENGAKEKEVKKEKEEKRRRSRSRSRKRSRSRDRRKRSRSRKRNRRSRSRSRERRKRSRSRDRKHRSRSRDRKEKKSGKSKSETVAPTSASADGGNSKISRDYDQEEEGFEQEKAAAPPKQPPLPDAAPPPLPPAEKKQAKPAAPAEENLQSEDMEISNSP